MMTPSQQSALSMSFISKPITTSSMTRPEKTLIFCPYALVNLLAAPKCKSMKNLIISLLGSTLLLGGASSAQAQLLEPQRVVPSSNMQVQLSYSPVVKQTALFLPLAPYGNAAAPHFLMKCLA